MSFTVDRGENAPQNGAPRVGKEGMREQEAVEMKALDTIRTPLSVEEDIMQLARLGEIGAIQKLFDTGKFDVSYADDEGITPLHWAAINNHYALCHFLIKSGVDVNARGGQAVATPVLWAAKKCHYYVVHLLLQNGADPLLTDDQGFNLLHSAVLDGNVFQIVLLLHQDIAVDTADAQGHTSLMWAAYKGYGAVVDLLLRWGANVYARDDQGFTALHWALVKGAQHPIFKLVEYGSDRFAENNEGKTPAITAKEMKSTRQWHISLSECNYNPDGSPRKFPLAFLVEDRRTFYHRAYFLWPFFVGFWFIYILSHFIVYLAVPLTFVVVYGLQWGSQWFLRWAPNDMKTLHKTPLLAGVFAGTLFWVGVRWITHVLPATYYTNPFLNLLFGAFFGLCTYFYFRTMTEDPGFVPKPGSRSEQKVIIEELLDKRLFDETHFCVTCMIRRPLRSKHCKKCQRCVAKQDHHCPWVDNCIGVNNHRRFVLYVLTMATGVVFWLLLTLSYLAPLPKPKDATCTLLSPDLCATLLTDPFTIVLTIWTALQLVWVSMLLTVQLVQVTRGLTTYEAMTSHHLPPANAAFTSFITSGATSLDDAQLIPGARGPDPAAEQPPPGAAHAHAHPHRKGGGGGCWANFQRALGIDTFLATTLHGRRGAAGAVAAPPKNPFSRGWIQNCNDFWCDPAPVFGLRTNGEAVLGGEKVDYTAMFDVPERVGRGG
ncbi:palmitoyltransferase akr1, partial [Trichodelitschia bisporula]